MRANLNGVAVVFDLDGTLIDTAGDLAAAMNHALREAGRPVVPGERVRHLVGHGARAMLLRGFEESGAAPPPEEMDRHLTAFLDYYLAHIADRSRPFAGAVEAIGAMREAGASMTICTNKREAPARLLIEALGLSALFDAIVGMDTASAPKPDAAPVRLCLERARADRGVFVGDSDTDIKAAAAAGLPCLVANFGYGPLSLADQAFGRFDDYRALPQLVAAALR
ncbi:MAG: HAD-IA family hydrolase [Pseudomonadota bacterium]|nr:HAD-IA family hydrolase [Pseudomonadota bacterium]